MGFDARRARRRIAVVALLAASLTAGGCGGQAEEQTAEDSAPPAQAAAPPAEALAQSPGGSGERPPATPVALQPKVQDLGKGRYRIGLIEVDKVARRIRIPGAVLRREPPLEFFAVATGGFKDYESLLELGATAYEINLACILVGLDSDKADAAQHHFDPKPVEGDPVEIWVEWEQEGKTTRVEAAELIQMGEEMLPRGEWVYTGSVFTPDGQYLAHLDGVVVGFVHDPSSIIEHRTGFGLGNFGAVTANQELLPPVKSRVTLIVEPRQKQASAKE
jgi:hypothetical protein